MRIEKKSDGLSFQVSIIPKSSKNQVVGIFEDSLKLKISKPPRDNLANLEVIKFLSKLLKTPKSSINIVAGKKNKKKKIFITAEKEQVIEIKKKIVNFS